MNLFAGLLAVTVICTSLEHNEVTGNYVGSYTITDPAIDSLKIRYCFEAEAADTTKAAFLVISKETLKIGAYGWSGQLLAEFPIACGREFGDKLVKNNCRTPEGVLSIDGIFDSTNWLYHSDSGALVPHVFGPWFMRVHHPATTNVGVHGTNAPYSIGHRCSHGCIRLRNTDIVKLVPYGRVDMPLAIFPSYRDEEVNRRSAKR